jgi:hypothetical protein
MMPDFHYEKILRDYLKDNEPEQYQELEQQNQLEDYISKRVESFSTNVDRAIEGGMQEQIAIELYWSSLIPEEMPWRGSSV